MGILPASAAARYELARRIRGRAGPSGFPDFVAQRGSDKEKFCSDLNRPEGCEMSEQLLKTLRKSADF